jgi:hypothetical protein
MSTDGRFRQLSPAALEKVLHDPELVEQIKFFEPPYDDDTDSFFWPPRVRALWDELVRSGGEDEAVATALDEEMAEVSYWYHMEPEDLQVIAASGLGLDDLPPSLDFCGAKWADMHLLVTGAAWDRSQPLSPLLGQHGVGEVDVYQGGPSRVLMPEEVAEAAAALAALSDDEMRGRYQAIARRVGYPQDLVEGSGGLVDFFRQLRDHYADAARRGNGMMVYLV